jgi:hypothetical protein
MAAAARVAQVVGKADSAEAAVMAAGGDRPSVVVANMAALMGLKGLARQVARGLTGGERVLVVRLGVRAARVVAWVVLVG